MLHTFFKEASLSDAIINKYNSYSNSKKQKRLEQFQSALDEINAFEQEKAAIEKLYGLPMDAQPKEFFGYLGENKNRDSAIQAFHDLYAKFDGRLPEGKSLEKARSFYPNDSEMTRSMNYPDFLNLRKRIFRSRLPMGESALGDLYTSGGSRLGNDRVDFLQKNIDFLSGGNAPTPELDPLPFTAALVGHGANGSTGGTGLVPTNTQKAIPTPAPPSPIPSLPPPPLKSPFVASLNSPPPPLSSTPPPPPPEPPPSLGLQSMGDSSTSQNSSPQTPESVSLNPALAYTLGGISGAGIGRGLAHLGTRNMEDQEKRQKIKNLATIGGLGAGLATTYGLRRYAS